MGALQVGVGLVLGVPQPVALEGDGLLAGVGAGGGRVGLALVLVVAEVQHDVGLVVGEVAVGGEVAGLVVGAAGEGHRERGRHLALSRGRAGATDRAEVPVDLEAVPVLPPGPQPVDLDVDGVGVGGAGPDGAAVDGATHLRVVGDLPLHLDVASRHAAPPVGGERLDGQAGPQDDARGGRVAGGDAELEGGDPHRAGGDEERGGGRGGDRGGGGDGAGGETAGEDVATREGHGPTLSCPRELAGPSV